MIYLTILWRGCVIVFFTAMNVRFISRRRYLLAFLTGFAISATWWLNAHAAAVSDRPMAWCVYGLGAAAGTLAGMIVAEKVGSNDGSKDPRDE